jgi:hypothetical protein
MGKRQPYTKVETVHKTVQKQRIHKIENKKHKKNIKKHKKMTNRSH